MDTNPQAELMTGLAQALPFKTLLKQVEKAIQQYNDDPSKDREGFIVFTMQIAMMSHVLAESNKTADDMMSEFDKHQRIADLFKENNN